MDWKSIDEDIKSGQLKRIYLLYGEERYLLRQYRDKIRKACGWPEDTMNYTEFAGKDIAASQIIDLSETMPFFADHRLILVEDSGWGKKTPDDIAGYLKDIPDFTILLFTEKEVDKRSKLYKGAEKSGAVVEFGRVSDNLLSKWVISKVRREGLQMTMAAYNQMLLRTGTDMETIDRELEKLFCYTMGRDTIEVSDVENIVSDHSELRIFDMVDSIASHKTKKAMEQYYDLIAQREPPMLILNLLSRQFHNMMLVKGMQNQGLSVRAIAQAMGSQEWLVKKIAGQCRGMQMEVLKKAVADAVEYESAVKTGLLADHLAVELFITEYAK